MSWKNWPYWLKGGIIFELISWILFLFTKFFPVKIIQEISINIIFIISAPFIGLIMIISGLSLPHNFFGILIPSMIIMFFLLGALIGWIIGKIKSRKQVSNSSKNQKRLKNER